MIDSHCHPNFPQYDTDRAEMIRRTLAGGVKMIAVGTNLKTSREVVALAGEHDGIWASVGLHPAEVLETEEALPRTKPRGLAAGLVSYRGVDNFLELMSHNRVVAVGEVGLDYFRIKNKEEGIRQQAVFKQFIKLAQDFNKPLILHCRCSPRTADAYSEAMEILDEMACPPKFSVENLGVAHSFTGDYSTAQGFIKRGFLIGLNGIITFSNSHADLIRQLPLDKILLETDSPYLAPIPYRGQRNEPLYIIEVAKKIATIKNISVEEVISTTDQNCIKLFNLGDF